ncbi:hypothetical protein I79_008046 [Cricetulus griseus]|uniref:Uncharacterized protein n=1 Tax=Cricetulus griseus TaxID=10029 RepID=G3HC05_CRIGR|nr:hypothetical protein I79_008046 [Cricetulus griseus]
MRRAALRKRSEMRWPESGTTTSPSRRQTRAPRTDESSSSSSPPVPGPGASASKMAAPETEAEGRGH